jgi:hypothetical protein
MDCESREGWINWLLLHFFGFNTSPLRGWVFVWIVFLGLKPQANFALPLWGWGFIGFVGMSNVISDLVLDSAGLRFLAHEFSHFTFMIPLFSSALNSGSPVSKMAL